MKTIPVFLTKFGFPCFNQLTNRLLMPKKAISAGIAAPAHRSIASFLYVHPFNSETDFRAGACLQAPDQYCYIMY